MGHDAGADDEGFARFERFLEEWSRRDFLKRMGGAAAYAAFSAGIVQFLEACGGGGSNSTSLTPVKGGKLIEGTISDISTFNTLNSGDVNSTQMITLLFDGLQSISAKGDNIPMLAQAAPTISSDQMTFTFRASPPRILKRSFSSSARSWPISSTRTAGTGSCPSTSWAA